MHKNKYDHNILLNDIQKLDKIQHKHSLVAIQFPDTSAEKKYLVYYDERWDCKLFLNYKTVDRADEESVINKVSADLNVDKSQINCTYRQKYRRNILKAIRRIGSIITDCTR